MRMLVNRLRGAWQQWTGEEDTPFDGDVSAWTVSFLVHLGIVIALAVMVMIVPNNQITLVIETDPIDEEIEQELQDIQEVQFDQDDLTEDVGAASLNGDTAALAQADVLDDNSLVVQEMVDITEPTVNLEMRDVSVNSGPVLGEMAVKGSPAGQGVTGAPGAVDQITYEILESLAQRKTMVVWLFDQSGSLQTQRAEIYKRFDKIYTELGVLQDRNHKSFTKYDKNSDAPLLTSIMAFGKDIQFMTDPQKPTADFAEIKDAVAKIENDPSGVERTFAAIKQAGMQYANARRTRNVMLIVVSDEVGDDEAQIEDTLTVLRRYQMPVYVVGIPAPFGRREAKVKFVDTDPKFEKADYWIPVRQGAESLLPERIKLAFWGNYSEQEQFDYIDSGFGPFSLTRLCYETGGIYFAVHPNRGSKARAENRVGRKYTDEYVSLLYKFWEPVVMRPYAPDYVTAQEYHNLVTSNKARQALLEAAKASYTDAINNPTITFVKESEGALSNVLLEAQKASARLEPQLRNLHAKLKVGEGDRPNLTRPRWQAGYDLAMGRVMAAIVRTEGYNIMLAELKGGRKFKNEKNNTWNLKPADEITTGSTLQKMAEQSKMYLERVVKDHPGTPWAFLAKKELDTDFGWKWDESFTYIPPPNMGNGNGTATNPADAINKLKRKTPKNLPKL